MRAILPGITGFVALLIAALCFHANGAEEYIAFLIGYMQGDIWVREGR